MIDDEYGIEDPKKPVRIYEKYCVLCDTQFETNKPYAKLCQDCNTRRKIKHNQKCRICSWNITCYKYIEYDVVYYFCPNHHWQVTHGKIDIDGKEIKPHS
jgi:hypothetical protein